MRSTACADVRGPPYDESPWDGGHRMRRRAPDYRDERHIGQTANALADGPCATAGHSRKRPRLLGGGLTTDSLDREWAPARHDRPASSTSCEDGGRAPRARC